MAKDRSRENLILKIACAVLALLSLALLIALIVVIAEDKNEDNGPSSGLQDVCPETTKLSTTPTRSAGLCEDLFKEEIVAVRDYILSQSSLNVTPMKMQASMTTISS